MTLDDFDACMPSCANHCIGYLNKEWKGRQKERKKAKRHNKKVVVGARLCHVVVASIALPYQLLKIE